MNDVFKIGGKELNSRLFVGTGKFPDKSMITKVLKSSASEVITVALRRVDLDAAPEDNVLTYIPKETIILPNTSGARTAEEAVKIAKIARAAGCGNWIKIEVIKDNKYLLPDNFETLKATEILVKEGFVVLPYMSPDLMVGKQMESVGAAAVMPLGAPIGTNRGLKTKELVKIMIEEIKVPIIVDAGIGKPSEAAEAMEMGAEAVLVNTAIATAKDPEIMGSAFAEAVSAGRKAFLAGTGAVKEYAEASSPLTGFLR
ncbi:thiazole synthase [Desulfitispora alkaliphila]|uniref:thiazole synthase n=1 Tax=Desulfitispora alkaliphila TaxID=622674 RepID=UPI003D23D9DE